MDVATLLGMGALGVGLCLGWLQASHRGGSWRSAARRLGFDGEGSGVVGGRGVRVSEQRGVLCVSVCIANRSRLLDEVHADDLLAMAPWMTPLARTQLATLAPLRGSWRVTVEGRTLRLSGQSATVRHAELGLYLIRLACELAEGVDSRSFFTRAAMAEAVRLR